MQYDPNNIFAKILRGEIPCDKLAENSHALAFPDINPQAPTHALVIPKGPYRTLDDLTTHATPPEIHDWLALIGETARQLNLPSGGYRLIINNGTNAHQEVPHLHAHLLGGAPLGAMLSPPPPKTP